MKYKIALALWIFFVLTMSGSFIAMVRAADLTPEDWQAALIEANGQSQTYMNRAQQLAITVAQQGREIAKLKAEAEKAKPESKVLPPLSPDAKQP